MNSEVGSCMDFMNQVIGSFLYFVSNVSCKNFRGSSYELLENYV